jgi:hypothetical protein
MQDVTLNKAFSWQLDLNIHITYFIRTIGSESGQAEPCEQAIVYRQHAHWVRSQVASEKCYERMEQEIHQDKNTEEKKST